MHKKQLLLMTSGAALAMAAAGIPATAALAQAAPAPPAAQAGPAVEAIVVTARRREENLMTVPVSVSVVTGAGIENRGIKNIGDLTQYTPGLFSQTGNQGIVTRGATRLTFRGLSATSGSVFIDGAPYTGAGAPDVTDVERVEALKGPQSVYFGRSTFSGALNYVTKKPGNEYGGRVTAEAFSYKGFDGTLSVEGPIIRDRLSFRANVRRYTFGGQYANNGDGGNRLGSQATTGVSLALAATPTDKLHISGLYTYTLDDDGAPVAATIKIGGPAPVLTCNLGGTGGPYWCGALPSADELPASAISSVNTLTPFVRQELLGNVRHYPPSFDPSWINHYGIKREFQHAHVNVDYGWDSGWNVAGLVAYARSQFTEVRDVDYRDTRDLTNPFYPAALTQPFPETALQTQSLVYDLSSELRISSPQDKRLRATVGGSYYRRYGPSTANWGLLQSGRFNGSATKSSVATPAVFGGLYFDVTPTLKLGAEARYQWDGITQQQSFPAASAKLQETYHSFSPRLTADWTVASGQLLYATWSKGYQPGGFNPNLVTLSANERAQLAGFGTNLAYAQEKLDNYEVGYKANLFNRRLRTTAALYYMTWRNGQVSNGQFIRTDAGATLLVTAISNVGAVDLKGAEFEADFAATRELNLQGTVGIADNEYKNYVYTPGGTKIRNSTAVNGNRLQQSPSFTATASAVYTRDIFTGWTGFLRLDWQYRSKLFIDPTNVAWLPARSLFNLRIGTSNSEGFRLEGYVNNLFNDKTLSDAALANDTLYGPGATCPPCVTAAAPPTLRGGQALNEIRLGLPNKRSFGVRAAYSF